MNYEEQVFRWLSDKGWQLFDFQEESWKHFRKGKSGLLNAPTGSGKTLALWISIVEQMCQSPKKGLKTLWITPLRSLSQEIQISTQGFLNELDIPLTTETRTGDTPNAQRTRQNKQLPDTLITTPESLHLMLASKGYKKKLESLTCVVIDEWHELIGSKRGVQVELALSRLKTLCPGLKIWGISATIGNMHQAMEVLLGPEMAREGVLVRSRMNKDIQVKSIIPDHMERFPWRGHLGTHLIDQVIPVIKASASTLVFTNTRSQCEIWFQSLLEKVPEWAGIIAMHHGSVDKQNRLWVEQALREGKLKVVVCTSSLDLGVDFSPVETIIQIGGPKGVARFMQRAGRSGHSPGKTSVIHFLPTHAIELVEAAALQKAVRDQHVEDRLPYLLCFDVLIQYLTTLAVSEGFYPRDIWPEVQGTFCYQTLTEDQWAWILRFITQGSDSLEAYDEFQKVDIEEDGLFKVHRKRTAMRHRMQIGTIVGDGTLQVKFISGGRLGTIEEWSAAQLKSGDTFTFAGRNLEFIRINKMEVLVRLSKEKTGKAISWMGSRMSLTARMSDILRSQLYEKESSLPEMQALRVIFERQQKESIVPNANQFLIETFKTREGYHTICYPFEGRFVHEAMSALLAYRMGQIMPISFSLAYNDYGFELLTDQAFDLSEILEQDVFSTNHFTEDLQESLNAAELARRSFRNIAVIAGLVFTGYPGKSLSSKHLQSGTQLIFDVFKAYEPDNLLLEQAYRETFEHQLEESRLRQSMERINQQELVWKACEKPTPFSFPIITDRLREKLSTEKLADRIKRMTVALEKT